MGSGRATGVAIGGRATGIAVGRRLVVCGLRSVVDYRRSVIITGESVTNPRHGLDLAMGGIVLDLGPQPIDELF